MNLPDDVHIEAFLVDLELEMGSHAVPAEGMCVLEAVARIAGERFSDSPKCVSTVIRAFLVRWNDDVVDDERQRLKAYIPKLVGSRASAAIEQRRGLMAVDWLIRVHTSTWLEAAGLSASAHGLQALSPLSSWAELEHWQPTLDKARDQAFAARVTPPVAGWITTWDAARNAARDAAWAAARDADAAGAWIAAWDAARVAARHAAWLATPDPLRPPVEALHRSALGLFDAMLSLS